MNRRGGGYQDFPSKTFYLTVPKLSVGGMLYCFIIFGFGKSLDKGGGVSRFSVEIFLSHRAEKFRRGTLSCLTNFEY